MAFGAADCVYDVCPPGVSVAIRAGGHAGSDPARLCAHRPGQRASRTNRDFQTRVSERVDSIADPVEFFATGHAGGERDYRDHFFDPGNGALGLRSDSETRLPGDYRDHDDFSVTDLGRIYFDGSALWLGGSTNHVREI